MSVTLTDRRRCSQSERRAELGHHGVVTLVLLHPLPLDGSVWDEELWSLDEQTVAPHLYDLGPSIEDWASGVLDLCDDDLIVVGNSIGGSCALEIALLAPNRVRLLVLVGAKAGHRPEPAIRDEALAILADDGIDAAWRRYWSPLFAPDADPAVRDRARSVALAQSVEDVMLGVSVFHRRPDRSAEAASVRVPVLVLSGRYDRSPACDPSLAAVFPRGQFRVVEGAGHYVPLERPQVLTTIVREALAGRR